MNETRRQAGRDRRRGTEKTPRSLEPAVSQARQGMDRWDLKRLAERMEQLEKKQRLLVAEAARLREENRFLRKEVKILGDVVLEVYHFLYQLLGKKPPDGRIHSRADRS